MTETAPRTTPESTPDVPVINAAPEALQLARLDEFVGYGRDIARQFEHEEDQSDYAAFRKRKIDELLAENGISDGDDESTREQYQFAKNIYEQIIDLDDDEWLTREDGAQVPRRNAIFRRVLEAYPNEASNNSRDADEADADAAGETTDEAAESDASDTTEADAETGSTDTEHTETDADRTDDRDSVDMDALHGEALVENARFNLGNARDAWSTLTAKRQGKAFGKAKGNDAVRDDYHAKVQALGIMELQDQINPEDDETTRNATVIAYLFEEQRRLRELTTEKLNGTKVGKFVAFMNRGKLGTRLLKGFGVGLVVGTGGALLLGATGAVAGAAIAVGASRFVKGYASNDRHRGMQTAEESFIDENGENLAYLETEDGHTLEQKLAAAARTYNEDFEADTKQEQVKRRKALAWGVGSVAVGAGVGYGIAAAADHSGAAIDAVKDWWNGPDAKDLTPNVGIDTPDVDAPDMDGDGIADSIDHDRDGDGVLNRLDDAPNNPDVTDRGYDWSDFNRDARFVEPNEGGFQTLKELGVPESKWEAVWQDAGSHLNDQGKTYMMADGHWGWSDDMRLSERDLDILAKAAERHGVTL